MLIIPGYTPDDKVPGAVAQNVWGAGKISVGQIALLCVLFGNKGSGGSAALNERVPVTTEEEADALFDARSELARMCHAALDVSGVTLYACPVEEASGGVSSYTTIVLGGAWTTGGELGLYLDEEAIRVNIAASHTLTTAGDAVEDAVNQAQNGRLFCTATNTAGSIVMETYTKGVRGNQHMLMVDTSKLPSGMTVSVLKHTAIVQSGAGPVITTAGTPAVDGAYVLTISLGGSPGTATFGLTRGGSSIATGVTVPTTPFTYVIPGDSGQTLTFANGTYLLAETYTWTSTAPLANTAQPFHMGSGSDDIQDALDGTDALTNDYIGLAHNDATNVGLVEIASNAKAAFDVGKLENYVTTLNATQAGAIAIGQTTMNDQIGTCIWAQRHPEHPSRISARAAAFFSVTEGADPNHNYDDNILPGAAPHYKLSDNPNRATLKTALNSSLTPLVTVDGKLQFVRAICSRSLSGSTPDYRTYDRGDVAVALRVRKEALVLAAQMRAENPYAGPDISEELPPAGTLTPGLWRSAIFALMQIWEGPEYNWLEQVAANPPEATWDSVPKRIMSVIPTIAKTQNHQIGVIVRQQSA
jgi:phage tail sheath gpL-like